MLDSGLRRGEVIRLKVSEVHIFEGYAVINGKETNNALFRSVTNQSGI